MLFSTVVCILFFINLCQTTVLEVAEKLGAKKFAKLAEDTDLIKILSGQGPFTVFVPTDDAFLDLPGELTSNNDDLKSVLLSHVLSEKLMTKDFKDDMRVMSNYRNMKVRINQYEKAFTVDGSKIITADQVASNGIVHMIDKVLYPLPQQNVLQFAASDTNFSTLTYAMVKSELQDWLSGGPFTLFAPTNEAFRKLPDKTLIELLENKNTLKEMLTYHIIKGTMYSIGLTSAILPTVQGQTVSITRNHGKIMINNAALTTVDLPVSNGVVHVIDTILSPPS